MVRQLPNFHKNIYPLAIVSESARCHFQFEVTFVRNSCTTDKPNAQTKSLQKLHENKIFYELLIRQFVDVVCGVSFVRYFFCYFARFFHSLSLFHSLSSCSIHDCLQLFIHLSDDFSFNSQEIHWLLLNALFEI